jgi:Cu(I)/Ag(I) efflux system membrane fusion protein
MNIARTTAGWPLMIALFVIGGAAGIAGTWYYVGQPKVETKEPMATPQPRLSGRSPDELVSAPPGGFDPAYVKTAPVATSDVPEILTVAGKLAFSAERTQQAAARVAGRIDRILAFEGHHVVAGQTIAELFSPDHQSAQQEYLLARNTLRNIKASNIKDLIEDAESTLQASRQKLRILGAGDADINKLDATSTPQQYLAVKAPISGVVVKRNLDPGQYLNFGDSVLTISDSSSLWFLGNIYEQDYAKVRIGQRLQLESPALPNRVFTGTVNFIAPGVDPVTHVLAIRCNVPNTGGQLRPELFVNARLQISSKHALVLPTSAIVQRNDAAYVIVDLKDGRYQRLRVTVLPLDEGRVAVTTGLKGGEQIVVEGAVLVSHLIDLEQS